jgi:integrase
MSAGSVTAYCSCADPQTGTRYPRGECPRWNARGHRRWQFVRDLPAEWSEEKQAHVRRQLKRGGFLTRTAAEEVLAAESHAIAVGESASLAARQTTLAEWLRQWLANQPDLKPSTRRTYSQLADGYLLPALGRARVTEIRPEHIRELLARVRAGKLGSGRVPSQQTVVMIHGLLRSVLNGAIGERLITWNPASSVKPGAIRREEAQSWTTQQRDKFLDLSAEKAPRLHAAFSIAAHRGLRRGELIALRWQDVDLEARTLRVVRNAVELGSDVVAGDPKSKRSRRTVHIGPQLAVTLKAHRKAQLAERMAASAWHDDDLLTCQEDGRLFPP